jgi:hypothetical protein
VKDALRDSDWVLVMQEELNNFTRNEVWHLILCPNQKCGLADRNHSLLLGPRGSCRPQEIRFQE